jgi:hypothetical protein
MIAPKEKWWKRACVARLALEARFLDHPEVSMIDFGLDPQAATEQIAVRVHVRRREAVLVGLPEEIEGIPVRVIYGSYELQSE